MTSAKKEKYIRILSRIRKEKKDKVSEKNWSDHRIQLTQSAKHHSLFDYLLFQALLEQAEGLSLAFTKPHCYRPEEQEAPRLSKEVYENLEKAAILRPTRLGPLTLIG